MSKYNRQIPEPGTIVKHFKRETVKGWKWNEYLYEIIGLAKNSEDGNWMMVYKALYGSKEMYVRPLDMFMSEVDHEKYPDIRQKYRFVEYHGAIYM